MRKGRKLTVGEFYTHSYRPEQYSRIMIQGRWLRDLGFTVGKKVVVKIAKVENENNKNKLIISLVE